MAVILVLVCGGLGFTSALAGLLLFEFSLLQAFGLWMSAGFGALILAVLPLLLAPTAAQGDRQTESA